VLLGQFQKRIDCVAGARAAGLLAAAFLIVACEQESKPRSFEFFMEDGFAREGVLARCNQSPEQGDVECANARRAASAIAAQADSAKSSERAAQSERKLVAMRDRSARAEQAQHEAEAAAQAANEAAYEARWRGDASAQPSGDAKSAAPAFGAPLGQKMPGMSESAKLDETFGESLSQVPARPEIELAAVEPPKAEVSPPRVEIEKTAIIPRPFHQSDASLSR
jgi:hypothetical protein